MHTSPIFSFTHSFIHLFNKYLFPANNILNSMLSAGKAALKVFSQKTETISVHSPDKCSGTQKNRDSK